MNIWKIQFFIKKYLISVNYSIFSREIRTYTPNFNIKQENAAINE